MRNWKRSLSIFLAVLLLLPVLAGCGRRELDGVQAVEAYLKAETKGEFADYAKLTGTSEEELEKMYNETLDEMLEIFNEVEVLEGDFNDNVKGEIKNILSSVKYEVISSEKDEDDNYVVEVDVFTSDIFSLIFEKMLEAGKVAAGDMDKLGGLMIEAIQDAVAEQSYGEAVRCQIHINYDEDAKQYAISEEDAQELAANFFDLEGAMEELIAPSGTVYDNPYFNWTASDWNSASEDEKAQCCLAIIQEVNGYSDEEMAGIDINSADVQTMLQQMKDGIDLSFSSGIEISMGDYVELIKDQL